MNNLNMTQLLKLLSSMNKEDLEKTVAQANQIMNSGNKEELIDEIKKKLK